MTIYRSSDHDAPGYPALRSEMPFERDELAYEPRADSGLQIEVTTPQEGSVSNHLKEWADTIKKANRRPSGLFTFIRKDGSGTVCNIWEPATADYMYRLFLTRGTVPRLRKYKHLRGMRVLGKVTGISLPSPYKVVCDDTNNTHNPPNTPIGL